MPDLQTVALWGPTSSGKTAFLSQLYFQHSDEWNVFPTQDSLAFLEIVRPFTEKNSFPKATAVGTIQRVAYTFQNKKTGREFALVVEDRPGEESEVLSDEGKKRFNDALGLVLLFDAEKDLRLLERQIEQTLAKLNVAADRGPKKDDRPFAICLSKADLRIRSADDLQRAVERPREFVLEKISRDIVLWVDKFCSNYEFFPVSSIGVRLRHGVIEPIVFYDEALGLRMGSGGQPINLLRPFAWLFDRINAPGK
ncbi:MAG TPA: hypothetical protein VG759_02065 [Candidatus Angelobacter sp.]|nr:hypothetical protein [Candidatus Angelobacter sp.]